MTRKKWTAKEVITDTDIKFREKRKWQQALRRYVLEKNASEGYAMYFGLDIESFRKWIEIQFAENLNWENFASAWQFYHIVPLTYFDFNNKDDLKLVWNFVNIRVEKLENDKERGNRIDAIAAKPYFETLYAKTGFSLCKKMLDKIEEIEKSNITIEPSIEQFIIEKKEDLELIATLSASEFAQLNKGVSLLDVLLEKEILKKFG